MRDEVRERIDRTILILYRDFLKNLTPLYPLNPKIVFCMLVPDSCRVVSYQSLAITQHRNVLDIMEAFGSEDGCTHYDPKTGRCLVTYNNNGYRPRIRWTLAHELGHILCGHFHELYDSGRRELSDELWQSMEEEADYFAASLLAPFPAIRKMNVQSAEDISRLFGLSAAAANRRMYEFLKTTVPDDDELEECFLTIRRSVSPVTYRKPRYHDNFRSDSEILREESATE
jgi:hypothetical protein